MKRFIVVLAVLILGSIATAQQQVQPLKAISINGNVLTSGFYQSGNRICIDATVLAKALGLAVKLDSSAGVLYLTGQQSVSSKPVDDTKKQAIDAIEALNSAVTSGISYVDYCKRLADTRVITDKYTSKAPKDDATSLAITNALLDYSGASTTWGSWHGNANIEIPGDALDALEFLIPDVKNLDRSFLDGSYYLPFQPLMTAIWNHAINSFHSSISKPKTP